VRRQPTLLAPALITLLLVGCGLEEPDDQTWLNDPLGCLQQATGPCPNGGNTVPQAPNFGPGIDNYASYVGQAKCDPVAKPGVIAFKDLVLATYPCTSNSGIERSCSVGGKSEHKEGRAWDWGVQYPHPAADAFLKWLLATDQHGNKHAMARRLGIMYMIWNKQVWSSYKASQGWRPYTGASPHTDHVHFSFSWDGANKASTFWTAPTTPPPPPPPPPPKQDAGTQPPPPPPPKQDAGGPKPPPPPKQDTRPPHSSDGGVDPGIGYSDGGGLPPTQNPFVPDRGGSDRLVGGCSFVGSTGQPPILPLLLVALALLLRRRRP
jgi:MYXO-CTERM domain-containing protein